MSLWDLPENSTAVVQDYAKDMTPLMKQRLAELGFRMGETVKCLKKTPFRGPKVYLASSSVFSLAEDLARGVIVSRSKT